MQLDGVLLLLHFSWFLNGTVLFVSSSPMHHQQQLYKFLNETFLLLGRPSSFMFPFVCPLWPLSQHGSILELFMMDDADKGNNTHNCSCKKSANSFSSRVYGHSKVLFWNCICDRWFIFSLVSNFIPSLNLRNVIYLFTYEKPLLSHGYMTKDLTALVASIIGTPSLSAAEKKGAKLNSIWRR